MKCLDCDVELAITGNHMREEDNFENHKIVSTLICPECSAFVVFYHEEKEK